jgi:alpha-L-fucosidase
VHLLARSASLGANLLLNVGPTPDGEIMPVHAWRLRQMGTWLRLNGTSIYGTRAGVIPPTKETVSTRRGDAHYVHVLNDISDNVTLVGVPAGVQSARLLRDGTPLEMLRRDDKTVLLIPEDVRGPFDTVVELR